MPTGIPYGDYNADRSTSYMYETDANHNRTDILKSVKEQVSSFQLHVDIVE